MVSYIISLDVYLFFNELSMNNNVEQLKTEVDDIKKSLNELKNNVSISEVEKKNQAETLKNKAEEVKQKVQNEIDLLDSKTDDESKKNKEEAEAILNSFAEITNLYTIIIGSSNDVPSTVEQPETSNKNIFWKIFDWIKQQWRNICDKEKRKTEWWKNLLRTAWFALTWVWAVALAYKWIKKLFWWGKDEDNEEENEEDVTTEENEEENKQEEKEKKSLRRRAANFVLDLFEKKTK